MKSNQVLGKRVPRKTAISRALATMAGALFFSVAVWADTGGLRIAVSGDDGKPLSGVTVKIGSPSSLVSKTAVTEADGTVRVSGLDPARDYTVEVIASGFKPFSADNVAVVGGQSLNLGYVLAANNLDSVVVTGRRLAAMDTTSATVGTVLTLDVVESLPTNRSYTGYLGDAGTPPPHGLMDFAGWFEAFLGGQWHVFDPRNNVPRIGRILVARTRCRRCGHQHHLWLQHAAELQGDLR